MAENSKIDISNIFNSLYVYKNPVIHNIIKYNDLESKINQYNNTLKIKNDELNLYRNDAKKVFFDNLKIVMTEYSNIKSINLILKKNYSLMRILGQIDMLFFLVFNLQLLF